ncbi:UbiA prenyltransferase [Pseudodesulfovibrio mercurii]|uniref:heme o synthase n=1 Tax=Pseudodesulfovibrio mercurii TaxID=641491 RepID=F0JJZ9_9BACT|nr:UbiA family prenyltransferase [Pseudodesulfovibrio mercurii]EGB16248.1 UbiA prenyltransferase [Pseudodesulfovibrio mercurii]
MIADRLASMAALIRPKVSLAVAAGSLFGALYHGHLHGGVQMGAAFTAAAGAFLLCGGCSALNQVQERGRDARMARTRERPLASGRMTPGRGALRAGLFGGAGLLLFFLAGGWPVLLAGLAVVAVYNGLYTPLKTVSPTALLAGGVAGAAPPLTGWLAAGGPVLDPHILGVTAIFYLWQVPHFWLLAEKHRADYIRAGFAVLGPGLDPKLRAGLMGVWVAAYFTALGCFAGLAGPASLRAFVPPVLLLAGAAAAWLAASDHPRPALAAMHCSLPLGLATLLLATT